MSAKKAAPDVVLELGGDKFTLRFDLWSLKTIKDNTGLDFWRGVEMDKLDLDIDTSVALIWAGLLHHHPEMEQEEVGRRLSPIDIGDALASVAEALVLAMGGGESSSPKKPVGRGRPRTKKK